MISSVYNGYPVHLIESLEELNKIKAILTPNVYVGLDSETTGLEYTTDVVVGICISCGKSYDPKHYHGFYIPLRHINYKNNLPIKETIEFTQYIIDNYITVWWNRNYDATMLEKDGIKFPCVGKTHDAQAMAFLIKGDSYPALKDFAQDYLKFNVIHYSENNAKDNSFATTDPTVSYVYGGQDPISTALLARKIWADYPYIHKIYPIDNKFGECMRRIMNTAELYIDKSKVEQLLQINGEELQSVKAQIYQIAGYQFNIGSNRDKADVLSRFVTLTAKTKSGAYKVDAETLEKIDHPIAKLLIRYANLTKFRSTYLQKMLDFPNPFHINYNAVAAATGRLASGSSKGNSYFADFNIQNVPKESLSRYLRRDNSTLRYSVYETPLLPINGVLQTKEGLIPISDIEEGTEVLTKDGYKKILSKTKTTYQLVDCGQVKASQFSYIVEGDKISTLPEGIAQEAWLIDVEDSYSVQVNNTRYQIKSLMEVECKAGMRECFNCPKGYVWISCDYSAQEMRILSNLSNEPVLIEPLLSGQDIHKFVAIKMFGFYDKHHRTIAKSINFASNYGGTGYTIAKRLGISQEEGDKLLKRYQETLSAATRWKEEIIKEGKRKGLIFTPFGRPRAVWMYFNSSDRSMRAFGERTCMNSPIQGAGGDIIRIDHIKYNSLIDPLSPKYDKEFAENTKYICTVHDEINLYVKFNYIQQAIEKLQGIMYMKFPDWKVPLTTSASVGVSWGSQIEIKGFTPDGVIIPDCEEDLTLL